VPADSLSAPKNPYKFRATQLIAPAALVGLGATGLFAEPVRELNRDISAHFAGNPRHGFDDYVQYAPVAAPYILKLSGVRSRHDYGEYTILAATSYLSMGIMVSGLKYAVGEMRPDGSRHNSFPSGHTATAFMGAELLRAEFWDTSPWIGIAGYAVAGTVGYMRLWHNRHWATDVLAGAGIGILSVRIAYWTFPALQRLFFGAGHKHGNGGGLGLGDGLDLDHKKSNTYITAAPYYNGLHAGGALMVCF
jgi:membrane-associated phospholipid phosphatase